MVTNTSTETMSNIVTQTQPDTEMQEELEVGIVPTHSDESMGARCLRTGLLAYRFRKIPMIQLSLDGSKAMLKQDMKNQLKDGSVTTFQERTMDDGSVALGIVAIGFRRKSMVQLTLDGSKAIIKKKKTITVRRHFRKKRTEKVETKIKLDEGTVKKVNDPEYQLTLKLMGKIRFEDLMEHRTSTGALMK